jgi:protein-S-isoprenylcysteine O-methyltransferase Ste14
MRKGLATCQAFRFFKGRATVPTVNRLLAAIPPAAVLAALLTLIGTQAACLLVPARASWPMRLAVSLGAVVLGEALGLAGLGRGLTVGDLHPYQDLALLAAGQWALARWRAPVQA